MAARGRSPVEGNDLGAFLRSRRARLTPEDVGIPSYGTRRVAGLRREELAQLAGVSATYYTRLEQGLSTNASEAVIEALCRALALDEAERAHLHDLARPARGRPRRRVRHDMAPSGVVQLIGAMPDVPALVLGRRTEVLAWNDLGHRLLAGHLDAESVTRPSDRPILTKMLFLDPHYRALHAEWDLEAARAVASLRLVAGRFGDDPQLAELVGELSLGSSQFARLWAQHPVQECTTGVKRFHHPEVGELTLAFEVLHLPGDQGRRVLTFTAPDASAQAALQLLAAGRRSASGPRPLRTAPTPAPGSARR